MAPDVLESTLSVDLKWKPSVRTAVSSLIVVASLSAWLATSGWATSEVEGTVSMAGDLVLVAAACSVVDILSDILKSQMQEVQSVWRSRLNNEMRWWIGICATMSEDVYESE